LARSTAISHILAESYGTPDLGGKPKKVETAEIGDLIRS
jgi:hypothetical protein